MRAFRGSRFAIELGGKRGRLRMRDQPPRHQALRSRTYQTKLCDHCVGPLSGTAGIEQTGPGIRALALGPLLEPRTVRPPQDGHFIAQLAAGEPILVRRPHRLRSWK
ncbi:MAG: hypothetical protein O7B23_13850 [Deltaproteobacteria bacterium]|nr:hypothetical protein [Deltaproteobacteria bacterium]